MKVNSTLGRHLVAIAVAGSCGYLHAASTTATPVRYTDAAVNAASATADLVTGNIVATMGAAYTTGNAVTLTLQNGAQFSGNAANIASPIKCSSAGTSNSDLVLAYQLGGESGSTAVTYLVQSVSAGQATSGLECSFGPRHLLTRTLPTSGNGVGVAYSAAVSTNGAAIDNAAVATATIARVASQFSFGSVSGVSGNIDVTTNRLLFTADPTAKPHRPLVNIASTGALASRSADAIQFRTGNLSISASASAAQQTFEINFTGDFSFVDDTGGECSGTDLSEGAGKIVAWSEYNGAGSAAAPTRLSISTNCQTLTYKVSPANSATNAGTALTTNGPDNVTYHTISLQRATDSTGLQYSVGSYGYLVPSFGTFGTTTATGGGTSSTTGAGSFTSNGLVVDVPYMPFGNIGATAVGHVLVWNNRSTQSATLSVQAFMANSDGTTTRCAANSNLATIPASGVVNISTATRTYVAGCFPSAYTATGGPRVALRYEANLPASSSELYSSFTVGSDRAAVANSSTGRGAPRSN